MLQVIRSLHELNFRQLMEIHIEANLKKGKDLYPNLTENQQIINAEQDFYSFLKSFFADPQSFYAVWVPEDVYVSAVRLELYKDGLLLEGLETAPALRRKGYAKALIDSVIVFLRDQGDVRIYSHVHKNNTPSLAVHKACGFDRILEYAAYVDGSVLQSACTLRYEGKRMCFKNNEKARQS